MSVAPLIYHGTPMTPRAALIDVCTGRAMCVSFYRPDSVGVVEAISPAIMFRQWRLFVLAGSSATRRGMVLRRLRLDALFRLARTTAISAGAMGDNTGRSRRAFSTQRRLPKRLAIWFLQGLASLAHGRPDRTTAEALRAVRPCLSGLDRAEGRQPRLSRSHGGSRPRARQSVAADSHVAWYGGRGRIPVRQCRQHFSCSKWVAL